MQLARLQFNVYSRNIVFVVAFV